MKSLLDQPPSQQAPEAINLALNCFKNYTTRPPANLDPGETDEPNRDCYST